MNIYWVILIFCLTKISATTNDDSTVNINDDFDNGTEIIKEWFIQNGMDPLKLSDITQQFKVTPGVILRPVKGTLYLTNGWMTDLSLIQRNGDATLSVEDEIRYYRFPIEFKTIVTAFDYKIRVLLSNRKGGVEGKIKKLNLMVGISFNTKNSQYKLEEYEITNRGKTTVRFIGHPLVDWLVGVITNLTTNTLHKTVQNIVQNTLKDVLENYIETINLKISK